MANECPKCQTNNSDESKFCMECATPIPGAGGAVPTKTLETPTHGLAPGTIIAEKYKVIEVLGIGGMGVVYKVEDTKLKRMVALKFLSPVLTQDKEAKERFIFEAQAASALDHNNICTVYEIDESDGQMFIAMAFVEGQSLREKITQGPLNLDEALDIAIQIAEGLHEAHEKGIVHRDIKSANIMVTSKGQARIMDFGIAKLSGETKFTKTGTTIGTISYMSPEQARGEKVDHKTDIWSLGVILYEMVIGQLPFKGDHEQAVMYSILNEHHEPLTSRRTGVPMELEGIVKKSLSKNPNERYQHTDDLLVDLRSLIKGIESGSTISKIGRKRFPKKRSVAFGGIGILMILLSLAAYYLFLGPKKAIDSIAVLPFINTAADQELEYLSEGMTERIISSLTKLPSLNKVIAHSSVIHYKGKEIAPKQVGEELGVKALLISRISQRGDELSISVELVNVEENSRIWGNQYKRSITEIQEIQNEISTAITENLRLELKGDDYQRMTKQYTENSEAYQLYLKGRYFTHKETEEGLKKGLEFYQQAVEKDPEFALAYAGMSDTYKSLGWFNFTSQKTAYENGVSAALRALEIDDSLGDAYAALASHKTWYGWERDLKGAVTEYEKALSFSPHDAEAYHECAHLLVMMGKYDAGIKIMKQALELEPLSIVVTSCLGQSFFQAELYDEAIAQLKKAIEMDQNYAHPYGWLGMAYLKKEMYDQAVEMLQRGSMAPQYKARMIGALGYTYAVQGMCNEALQQLEHLKNLSKEIVVDPCFIAWIYTGLGEKDKAFEWLEKAYEEKSSWLAMINADHLFDPLRSDARFTELLVKIGFDS